MDYHQQILQLAMSFINLPSSQIDTAIQKALQQTADFCGADRAFIFTYNFVAGTYSNTHEWCGPGISAEINNLQNVPLTNLSDWISTHTRGELIHIPDVAVLSNQPLRDILMSQQIKSLITLPMMSSTTCTGFVGFDLVKHPRHFGTEEIELLRLFAALLVNLYERTNKERQLREKERRLRAVIDGVQAGTWEWNVQTGVTLFNEQWATMLGFQLSDLEPTSFKAWQELTHPDDLELADRLINQHLSGQSAYYNCEMRMRHNSGHWVWIQSAGRIYEWTEEGLPVLMAGTHTDITGRKQAEKALRESEKNYRSLFELMKQANDTISKREALLTTITENIDDTIVMLDREHHLVYMNRATVNLISASLGQSDLELNNLVGKTANDFFPSEVADRLMADDEHVMQTGIPSSCEHPLISPGGVRLLCINRLPLRDSDGRVSGLVLIAHDISEAKKQEQQRLDHLKRQRDTLVREVHHRIKNHLQGVLGLMRNATVDQPDLAAMIETPIRRIKSIAEVYGMTSPNSGTAIRVSELVGRFIDSYPEQDQIEFSPNPDTQDLTLHTDEAVPAALIINELLNNAVKHRLIDAPPRPIKITLNKVQDRICLTIASGPACLPVGFDIDNCNDLGTGLELVKALMPSQGSRLEFEQRGDEVVVTYCFLADSQPQIPQNS